MSAIGKGNLKCKFKGCCKVRPYWADYCKAHRGQLEQERSNLKSVISTFTRIETEGKVNQ